MGDFDEDVNWRRMTMKYGAKCCKCGGDIRAGDSALYFKEPDNPRGWHFMHTKCGGIWEKSEYALPEDVPAAKESTLDKLKNSAKWRLAA